LYISTVRPDLTTRLRAPLVISLAAVLGACVGLGDEVPLGPAMPESPTWVNGISQLMERRCNGCHGADPADDALGWFRTDLYGDGASLGVVTMAEAHEERMRDRSRPMPPPPELAMTQPEVEAFADWVRRGAPYDDADGGGGGGGEPDAGGTGRVCTPGRISPCVLADGTIGFSTCLSDGTLDALCEAFPNGGGGGGGDRDMGADVTDAGGGTGGDTGTGGGGTGGGGTGGGGTTTTSLDQVVTEVFAPSCATLRCHQAVGPAPNLETRSGLRARLLRTSAQEPGMALVAPGDPDASYLFIKTLPDFASHGLGSGGVMPPSSRAPLSASQRSLLETWILEGAP
jgi:mono/diheme cytochrome c family protein